jgi:hypothetical protein
MRHTGTNRRWIRRGRRVQGGGRGSSRRSTALDHRRDDADDASAFNARVGRRTDQHRGHQDRRCHGRSVPPTAGAGIPAGAGETRQAWRSRLGDPRIQACAGSPAALRVLYSANADGTKHPRVYGQQRGLIQKETFEPCERIAAIHLSHPSTKAAVRYSVILARPAALKRERPVRGGWRRSATGQDLPLRMLLPLRTYNLGLSP